MLSMARAALALLPAWTRRLGLLLVASHVIVLAANVATWDGTKALEVVDLNGEANLTAWFASMLLATVAALAAGLWLCARVARRRARVWLAVSAVFLWLSLEEVAGVHERIGYRLDAVSSVADWPLVYVPALLGGVFVIAVAARDLPRPLAVMAGLGLGLFGLVVAAEVLSMSTDGSLMETLVEETAEVFGTVLILLALAATLTLRVRRLVTLHPGGSPSRPRGKAPSLTA
jgi:hypothetical protein